MSAPLALNDCWNRIGVRGDGSCVELKTHAHCRNCPVYSAAGVRLLERPAPAGYRAGWTEHLAETAVSRNSARQAVMIFRVGEEWLALPAAQVREVVQPSRVHGLPHRRAAALAGVVNVRGELLPCMVLAAVLGLEPGANATPPAGARPRFLVVAKEGERFVLPVDHVEGLHRFEPSALTAAPETVVRVRQAHVRQLLTFQGRSVGLIEAAALWASLQRSLT